MKIFKNNKGFTLVELIIVIVILGVLAGIAAPKMLGSIKSSKVNTAISNIAAIEKVTSQAFVSSSGVTPPTAAQIGTAIGTMPPGFTVADTTLTGSTTDKITLTITIDETKAGVKMADIDLAKTSLGGALTETGTTLTYTNTNLQ